MKKILVFLAAAFCLCMANKTMAQVASGTTGACTWTITGTSPNYTLTISGNGAMGDYNDYSALPWYSYRTNIKTLVIQQGVTTIGRYAFSVCSGATSVTIPNSVMSIGFLAFGSCSSLTSITIPSSAITIDNSAFSWCYGLTSIVVDANNPNYSSVNGVLFNKTQTTLIQYPIGKTGNYTIPNTVTTIGEDAFWNCNITAITIPNSVTTIEYAAFRFSNGLTSITIPSSVTFIGNLAFIGCDRLISLNVDSNNLVYSSINGVVFNKNKTKLLSCPAGKTGDYIIPHSVTFIEICAFSWCSGLTSLTIPNTVTTIEYLAFSNCSGLTSIYVKAPIPPSTVSDAFGVSRTIPVYVPCGSVTAYQSASGWNDFTNIIEDIPFNISVQSNNNIMGTVNITQSYTCIDSTAIIEATANAGHQFVQWNDGNTQNPRTITVTQDTNFIATFEIARRLTVFANDSIMGTVSGNNIYKEDTTVTIIAIPITDYRFIQWNDGNTQNPRTITVTQDTTFTAIFGIQGMFHVFVTVTNTNRGSVTGGGDYEKDSTAIIEAIPGSTYSFMQWGDGDTNNPRTITVTQDTTFTVTFEVMSSVVASGTTGQCIWTLTETSSNYTLTISGNGTMGNYTSSSNVPWSSYRSNIKTLDIQQGVTSIGDYTFQGCYLLPSVTIPNSVMTIGESAFAYCYSLPNITIPNSVISIGKRAFYNCMPFTSVSIPASVTYIGYLAFTAYDNFTSFSVDENNTVYSSKEGVLFNKNQTRLVSYPDSRTGSYVIPNTVTSIDTGAFWGCDRLTSINIPNTVTSIGAFAFLACYNLRSVTIPNSVTTIEDETFHYCRSLTSVTIGNSVTSIGDWAFDGCTTLVSVTIPSSVTSIEPRAFAECTALTSIYVKAINPPSILHYSTSPFYNVSTTIPVYVPCGSTTAYQSASGWSGFTNIIGDIPLYNITVQSNNNTMGTVNITQANTCTNNTAIIEATENSAHQFVQWNDGNIQNPRTITVTQDTSFTAMFEIVSGYVVVGQGTTTNYYTPINTYYNYSFSRQLYYGTELNSNGTETIITSLAWYYTGTAACNFKNQTCYFKAVEDNSISTNSYIDPLTDGATLVWSDSIRVTASGWVEITLNTPFVLPAGKNLLIYWNHQHGSYYSTSHTWAHTTTSSNTVAYGYSDNSFSAATISYLNNNNVRPNALFGVTINNSVMHHVTISANNAVMGTVTGSGDYGKDSIITITATPNTGYQFVQWNDGNTQNPRTITVTQDTSFMATFESTHVDSCILIPDFTISDTTLCSLPDTIIVTGRDTNVLYHWEILEGIPNGISDRREEYFRFPQGYEGTYNLKLTITDKSVGSCSIDTVIRLHIYDKITPKITAADTNECDPDHVISFVNTTQYPSWAEDFGMAQTYWNFRDGTNGTGPTTTHVYGTSAVPEGEYPDGGYGDYKVMMSGVTPYGCPLDTVYQSIHILRMHAEAAVINPAPPALPHGCAPHTVTIANIQDSLVTSSPIVSSIWRWNFTGDNADPNDTILGDISGTIQHTYTDTGNYNVYLTLTNEQGCVHDIFVKHIMVGYPPLTDFTFRTDTNCKSLLSILVMAYDSVNNNGNLVAQARANAWEWLDDMGNLIGGPIDTTAISPNETGEAVVNLVSYHNGCPTNYTVHKEDLGYVCPPVAVIKAPHDDPMNGQPPIYCGFEEIPFINESKGAIYLKWYAGDYFPNYDTAKHSKSPLMKYDTILKDYNQYNAYGDSVGIGGDWAFTYSDISASNYLTNGYGLVTLWLWAMNDNSVTNNPTHELFNPCGRCEHVATQDLIISILKMNFTVSQDEICQGNSVRFYDSTQASVGIFGWGFKFDSAWNSDPNYLDMTLGEYVGIKNYTPDPKYGNGQWLTFTKPNRYRVVLQDTCVYGCIKTDTLILDVLPRSIPRITTSVDGITYNYGKADTLCINSGNQYYLRDSSWSPHPYENTQITGWEWQVGAIRDTGQNASLTLTSAGYYDLKLTVENEFGCDSTGTFEYQLLANNIYPRFTTSKKDVCNKIEISFTDETTVLPIANNRNTLLKLVYDWGDGDTSVIYSKSVERPTINHTYDLPNLKNTVYIKLTATIIDSITHLPTGCEAEYIDSIIVNRPVAAFTDNGHEFSCPDDGTGAKGRNIQFTSQAQGDLGNDAILRWNFGDTASGSNNDIIGRATDSFVLMPIHKYNRAGVYDVLFIVQDENTCTDSIWKKNHVVILGPRGSVSFIEDSSNCNPLQVTFYPLVEQAIEFQPDSIVIHVETGKTLANRGDYFGLTRSRRHIYQTAGAYLPVYSLYKTVDFSGSKETCIVQISAEDSIYVGNSLYNITVQSNNNTMGTVNITQANTCTNNTAIIEATPNTGYRFVQWNDGNTQNPRTITVTQDSVFTASFSSAGGRVQMWTEDFEGNFITFTSTPVNGWIIDTNYYVSPDKSIRGLVPHQTGDSVRLESSVFDCSMFEYITLQFSHICKISPFDIGRVEYRTETSSGMGTWRPIPMDAYIGSSNNYQTGGFNAASYPEWQANDNTVFPTQSWWKDECFDIGYEVGYTRAVQFRFVLRHGQQPGTQASYGWLVDNFEIKAATFPLNPPVVEFVAPLVKDTVYSTGPWEIKAKVKTKTNNPIQTPWLVFTATQNGITVMQDSILMVMISGDSLWKATIPQFAVGTKVIYSITGQDILGNSATATESFYNEALYHITITTNNTAMGTVTGSGDYAKNSTVIITATPNTGYQFVQWDDGNTQNPRTITVTQDISFTAIFGVYTQPTLDLSLLQISPWSTEVVNNQNVQVNVNIHNTGTTTITSATFKWSINGVIQSSFSWTPSLPLNSLEQQSVSIGSFIAMSNNPYDVVVWVENINGQTSTVNGNDTVVASASIAPLAEFVPPFVNDTVYNLSFDVHTLIRTGTGAPVTTPKLHIETIVNGSFVIYDTVSMTMQGNIWQASIPKQYYNSKVIYSLIVLDTVGTTVVLKDSTYIKYNKEAIDPYTGYNLGIMELLSPVNTPSSCISNYAPVKIVMANLGSQNYNFATNPVTLSVRVTSPIPFSLDTILTTGSLLSQKTTEIELIGTFPTIVAGVYDIKIFLNSTVDNVIYDDTLQSTYVSNKIALPVDEDFSSSILPSVFVSVPVTGTETWTSYIGSTSTASPVFGTGMLRYVGNYGSMSQLTTHQIDLHGAVNPVLKFWYYHDATAPSSDMSYTDVNIIADGVSMNLLTLSRAGATTGWRQYMIDLSPFTNAQCIRIQFESMNIYGTQAAQYIDRIVIASTQDLEVSSIFISPQVDACNLTNKDVFVVLSTTTNQSIDFSKDTTSLAVEVPGYPTSNYPLTGVMGGNTSDTVLIGSFNISTGINSIKAYLTSPVDDNLLNDTLVTSLTVNPSLNAQLIRISGGYNCLMAEALVWQDVILTNTGNMPLFDIELILQIDTGETGTPAYVVIKETCTDTILAGDSLIYIFKQAYNVPWTPVFYPRVFAYLSCDSALINAIHAIVECADIEDLYMVSIDNPFAGKDTVGATIQVKTTLRNRSDIKVFYNQNITFVVENSQSIEIARYTEIVSQIGVSATVSHTFTNTYTVPNDSVYYLTVYINHNDNYLYNDTLKILIHTVTCYHVTVNANNPTMGIVIGSGDYEKDSTATLTATANTGYRFVRWNDGITNNPRTITVTQDTVLTAIFESVYYVTVSTNDSAMGTVTGSGVYGKDSIATITATVKAGHLFVQWNDGNTSNPRTITVTQDTTFTATFEAIMHDVTINVNDSTMGTVTGNGNYAENSVIPIEAIPNAGYRFVEWNDGVTANPRTITVIMDTAFTATFELIIYQVTVVANNSTMGTVTGAGTYTENAIVTIEATPNTGYRFVQWNDGNTNNPRTITTTQDTTFMATFEAMMYVNIYVNNPAMGTVTGEGYYAKDSIAVIEAIPDAGYYFVEWNDTDTSNPRTIIVTQDTAFMATFEAIMHNVTVTVNDSTMGTVIGSGNYAENSTAVIEAIPNAGYRFVQWNDGNTNNPRSITVMQDTAFTATFEVIMHNITVRANNSIMGTITGYGTYAENTVITISATANSNYRFIQWNDGNTTNPRTITLTQDTIFTAVFGLQGMLNVYVTLNNTIMGTVTGSGDYVNNTNVTISATPNVNYRFIQWNDGNTTNPRTITLTQDTIFTAVFDIIRHELSVNVSDSLRGVVSGGGVYAVNSVTTIAASPYAGFRFVGWNDGNKDSVRTITVIQDTAFVAVFGKDNMYYVYAAPNNPTMGNVIGSNDYQKSNIQKSPIFKREYAAKSLASIEALPNPDHRFVSWNDGVTDNPREFTVVGDTIFMAIFETTTSITDLETSNIRVYPNPTRDYIHIVLPDNVYRAVFTLYDMQSKMLLQQEISSQDVISVGNLAKGIYIYNVTTDKQNYTGKLIINVTN
jgi:hypothetical protein